MSENILRRRVQIPSVGDLLVLDEDWTFRLFHEYRNETLLAALGKKSNSRSAKTHDVVTLPQGTELRVDRIYIRKGVKDFDSLTFLAKGIKKPDTPKLPKLGPWPRLEVSAEIQNLHMLPWGSKRREELSKELEQLRKAHEESKEYKSWMKLNEQHYTAKQLRRAIRFWAKLVDVNRMVVRSEGWTERDDAEPVLGARTISLDD